MAKPSTIKMLAGMNGALGLWLASAPVVFGLGTAATWNAVITGLVIASLGAYNYKRASDGEAASAIAAWTNLLAGAWVIAASFTLGAGEVAMGNDLVVGPLVVVFAGYNAIKGTTLDRSSASGHGSGQMQ